MPTLRSPAPGAGVTLLEVVAVAAVATVLLSVVLPGLRMARTAAKDGVSLSNLRQNTAAILAYAGGHEGRFPVADPPARPESLVQLRFPDRTWLALPYFLQTSYWHALVASADGEPTSTAFSPWNEEESASGASRYWSRRSDYQYSQAFMAIPTFWTTEGTQEHLMCRGSPLSQIRFPSAKSVLSRGVPVLRGREWSLSESAPKSAESSFADGHAGLISLSSSMRCVSNRMFDDMIAPCLTTEFGVSGRDRQ